MRTTCRACGSTQLLTLLDLGSQPPSNAFVDSAGTPETRYPLIVGECQECKLVQLTYDVPPAVHFNDHYAYHSSANNSEHWQELAQRALTVFKPKFVVEVASNDGYLLKHFKAAGCRVLGFEPSSNVAAEAIAQGIETSISFFDFDTRLAGSEKADLLIACNVLAHVPRPGRFIEGVARNLKADGTAIFEFPHLLEMVYHNEFDTIYHEHYSYWSLCAFEQLLARHDLRVVDLERLEIHGGSLRVYVQHADYYTRWETAAVLDCRMRENRGLAPWKLAAFALRARGLIRDLQETIAHFRLYGKRIAAFGAAAKGNTLLNSCGLTRDDISCIADSTPWKRGKLAPGSLIPVVSPEAMLATNPDYILLLAWNWKEKILPQLKGHKVIVPIPKVEILDDHR